MNATKRKRRAVNYDPSGRWAALQAHALEVSALVRELQAHLDRVRRDEASEEELRTNAAVVRAARRARGINSSSR